MKTLKKISKGDLNLSSFSGTFHTEILVQPVPGGPDYLSSSPEKPSPGGKD